MLMAAAPPENPSSRGVGSEEDEEKERADADLRQTPDHLLQDMKLRKENMIKFGVADRLNDSGKKLRASLDAVCRELARRKLLNEAPHSRGGPTGAPAQDEKTSERVVQSKDVTSSGTARDSNNRKITIDDFLYSFGNDVKTGVDISSSEITSRSHGKPNASVKSERKFCHEKKSCKSSAELTNSSQEELYFNNSANMEKISSNDIYVLTPSRKRKGDTSVGFSMRLRSRKGEVVLLDGDTPHPESTGKTLNKRSSGKLYYPTRDNPNSIEISPDDIKCLEPESFLSSPIMNFYIMYLQGLTPSTLRPRGDYHIFNTYFFSKLEDITSKDKTAYFLKLRRWWKGVDIFRKAYILLPVHADTHWSLVIICMPTKDDNTGPVILHLDSLKFHNSRLIFTIVSRFLKDEWRYLNENVSLTELPLQQTVWKNLPRKIEKKKIEVPQQENDYDCGVFVLYNMQRFIQEAPERLNKKKLPMFGFGKHWFRPEEASQIRLEIHRLVLSCGQAEPKNDSMKLSFWEAQPNNGTTEPSCGEAEPKNDAAEQSCVEVGT